MNDAVAILLREGVVDAAGAEKIRSAAATLPLDDAIARAVTDDQAMRVLAAHFELPYVELGEVTPGKEFLSAVSGAGAAEPASDAATRRGWSGGGRHQPAVRHGRDRMNCGWRADARLSPVLASQAEIDECIKRLLGIGADTIANDGERE